MVLVSHKYKFIYIKNEKVAGSSVESFFGKFCQDPNKEYHYNDTIYESIDEFGIIGKRTGKVTIWNSHKPAKDIKRDLGDDIFNKYLKFCVIRNPYDKMVSKYYFRSYKYDNGDKIFKEYAQNKNCNNLNIHSINGNSVCDYYIRYENLEEDIIKLCDKLGIEDYNISNLPKHKSTERKDKSHYSTFYDEETRKIVYENHKKEFELFGYTFDKI